jgi:trans-aconitate 2-methyltransferase
MAWDPLQYNRFSTERNRPFFDLVNQIGADRPATVTDLGCGTGELTATLTDRWPGAAIHGIDSSPEMLADRPAGQASFSVGRAEDFDATGADVLLSNALLQWVPNHRTLLQNWAAQLNHDGWLAFQVPANFGSPSHVLMRELAESARWQPTLGGVLRHGDAVSTAAEYLDLLTDSGLTVNAWQTEYQHLLFGDDPVLQWVSGTGLRPVLAALDDTDRAEFVTEYAARLRAAYPARSYGTVFGFQRTFVVAHKP